MAFVPNTTPTPNWLYNGEMKKMNETELKVVLLVTRKTLGWFDPSTGDRKNQDYISQSQFMEFTGKSNRAIATAIQSCVEHGWIIGKDKKGDLCNTPEKRARRKIWYQLGSIFTSKISSEECSQDENLVNISTSSGEHNDIHLVNIVHSTKETITKETKQKTATTSVADLSVQQINLVMEKFQILLNPTINYGNKTQRKAIQDLLDLMGEDKLIRTIEYAASIINEQFAPMITTPYQLKEKLAQLTAYYQKSSQPKKGIIQSL